MSAPENSEARGGSSDPLEGKRFDLFVGVLPASVLGLCFFPMGYLVLSIAALERLTSGPAAAASTEAVFWALEVPLAVTVVGGSFGLAALWVVFLQGADRIRGTRVLRVAVLAALPTGVVAATLGLHPLWDDILSGRGSGFLGGGIVDLGFGSLWTLASLGAIVVGAKYVWALTLARIEGRSG